MDLRYLTWTCHVCGEERPDNKISVHKRIHKYPNGVTMGVNTRYCNDRPECEAGAPTALHFPNDPLLEP